MSDKATSDRRPKKRGFDRNLKKGAKPGPKDTWSPEAEREVLEAVTPVFLRLLREERRCSNEVSEEQVEHIDELITEQEGK